MQKLSYVVLLILAWAIKTDAQKLSLELSTKKYFLLDKKVLKDNEFQYQKYTIGSPIGLAIKYIFEPNIYVRSGLAYRQEKLELHNKKISTLSGNTEQYNQQLCHLELPLAFGVTYNFHTISFFADYGFIFSQSIHGKTKDYTGLYNDYSFKEINGKYIDQNLRTGIGVKCSSKIRLNLSGEYRTQIWRKIYQTEDFKYVYNFPSHNKGNYVGLNLSLEYDLK